VTINLKEVLDSLLNPKYLKPIILIVAVLVLFRNAYYLLFSDVTRIFLFGQQESLKMVFDIEVPMLLMTVIWTVIFSILNRMHDSLRVNSQFFYSVLATHAITCLVAAAIIYSNGCFGIPFTSPSGEVKYQGCNPIEFNSTVFGGTALTLVSVVLSHYIYSSKNLFQTAVEPSHESNK